MNGLLDYGRVDPLALGLLGAGSALMTPRAMGGGVPAAFNQFSGGMLQGQQLLRQQALDQQRQRMLEQEMAMRQQEFDLRRDETTRKRATEDALRNAARRAIVPGTVAAGPTMDEPGTAATPTRLDSERFISELAQVAPMEAAAMLQQKPAVPFNKLDPKDYTPESLQAFAQTGFQDYTLLQPRRRVSVSDGVAYDPEATQPGPLPPNPYKLANEPIIPDGRGGFAVNPLLLDARRQIAAAGATRVNTPVTYQQESAESQAVGKYFGQQFADLQNAGMLAQSKINNLNRLEQLLDGVRTGKLTPTTAAVSGFAEAFGIKLDPKLGALQAAEALSNELALQARNPSGGAGMPGAMSNADRQFLQNIVPGLAKTPEGNRLIIETTRKLAQREVQVARLAADYRRRNGSLDDGFLVELQRFADANPLFPQAAQPTPTAPATQPPAAGGAPRVLRFDSQGNLVR